MHTLTAWLLGLSRTISTVNITHATHDWVFGCYAGGCRNSEEVQARFVVQSVCGSVPDCAVLASVSIQFRGGGVHSTQCADAMCVPTLPLLHCEPVPAFPSVCSFSMHIIW